MNDANPDQRDSFVEKTIDSSRFFLPLFIGFFILCASFDAAAGSATCLADNVGTVIAQTCPGVDMGDQVNSAIKFLSQQTSAPITNLDKKYNYSAQGCGTISIPAGYFPFNHTIAITNPCISLIGQGRRTTVLAYTGSGYGHGIDMLTNAWGIPPLGIAAGGVFRDFSIDGLGGNGVGIAIGNLAGFTVRGVEIGNFSQTGGTGILFENTDSPQNPNGGWTERMTVEDVHISNCQMGMRFFRVLDSAAATPSFEHSHFQVYLTVASGQVGLSLENGADLSRGSLELNGNVSHGGTLLHIDGHSTMLHEFLTVATEVTDNLTNLGPAVRFQVDKGGALQAFGMFWNSDGNLIDQAAGTLNLSGKIDDGSSANYSETSNSGAGFGNVTSWNGYTVFGPNATTPVGAALGLGYSTTDTAANIVAAKPGSAWLPLRFAAQESQFFVAGAEEARIDASGFAVSGDVNIASNSALRFGGTQVCSASGCTSTSDERLKENISSLKDSYENVLKLRGVEYDWKDKTKYGSGRQIGFLAQDVEKIFPQVVATDPHSGFKSLAYDHLVAPLVEAFKTLAAKLDTQSNQVSKEMADLRTEIARLKAENAATKAYLCGKDPAASVCKQ